MTQADIVVMSKFLSSLTAHKETAITNLEAMLKCLKPGSMVVYFDNATNVGSWLPGMAKKCLLSEVR